MKDPNTIFHIISFFPNPQEEAISKLDGEKGRQNPYSAVPTFAYPPNQLQSTLELYLY